VDFLIAERIADILPKLGAAALRVAEPEKTMSVPAERL
jgi:hypothetical protein